MAVTSNLNIALTFTGDAETRDNFGISENQASPGQNQVIDLISGDNTITLPTGGGSLSVAVIIIPPPANAIVLTLKGDAADVGVALGLTNPTSIAVNSVSSFIINAADVVVGLRLIFV